MSKWRKRRKQGSRTEVVKIADINVGPARHERLPAGLERVARWQYRHLGHLFAPTWERWELNYRVDLHPEREIAIWSRMTWAVLEYLKGHPGSDKRLVAREMIKNNMGEAPTGQAGRELLTLFSLAPLDYLDPSSAVFDG